MKMNGKGQKRKPQLKHCSNCGNAFFYAGSHRSRNKNFFCCNECYIAFKTKKISVKCDWCGDEFMKKRSDVKRSAHNFCSQQCCLLYRQEQGKTAWSHRVDGEVVYRKIVEEKLGKKLSPKEEVHHIDGDHFNNDPDNLAVLSKSEHSKIHASWKGRDRNGRFVTTVTASQLSEILH